MGKMARKLHVKVKPWKLQGLVLDRDEATERMVVMMVEVKWKEPKRGIVPFYRPSKVQFRNSTRRKCLAGGGPGAAQAVEWDDEFENLCCFSGPWTLSFHVLCGEGVECNKTKLEVIGKASLDLGEFLNSTAESTIERKLPIRLKGFGTQKEAILVVSVSFVEDRTPPETAAEPKMVESPRLSTKKEPTGRLRAPSVSFDSSESDPSRSPGTDSSSTDLSSGTDFRSALSPEPRSESASKPGFFSWKKRRLSFSRSRRKEEFIKNLDSGGDDVTSSSDLKKEDGKELIGAEDWMVKELVSRDGKTVLKSSVFLSSFDQRSEKAAGESACTVLVAVMAHWLHSNPDLTPSRSEFDQLITQGSSLWQNLCNDQTHVNSFPDKHFDLETVLGAKLRPLTVSTKKSFTGFFSPEKFESLNGLMSFDQLWDEVGNVSETRVYIVSWNDHFFVMKIEPEACYIVDSLGERLFEGCKQAYVLKFDGSSAMHVKVKHEKKLEDEEADDQAVVATGKECCREYMKRFLAAIVVEELEAEEKKGKASVMELHRRLQIDFHYTALCSW